MIVVTIIAFCILIHVSRINRTVRKCIPVTRADITVLLERLSKKLHISYVVGLYATDDNRIGAPSVAGIVKPRIFLPDSMAKNWQTHELEPILLHELTHIKHHHLFFNWIQVVLQMLYFFPSACMVCKLPYQKTP